MAHFKAARAADSLNGLKRLNGAGELPRSMVREAPGVDAVGREAGYSQLARVPYASMAPASAPDLQTCFQSGFVPNNGAKLGKTPSGRSSLAPHN